MSGKAQVIVDDLMLETYKRFTRIAAGGFGDVYKGEQHKLMNEDHAVKIQSNKNVKNQREVQILMRCKHPNILPVIYAFNMNEQMYIVTPLYKTNLGVLLLNEGNLPLEDKVNFFLDILKGINYLHGNGIMHLDLKPLNILVDEENRCVLADFGLTKIHKPNMTDTSVYTSHMYTSPERTKGAKADFADDIWGLGCTLYEILEAGTRAYPDNFAHNLKSVRKNGAGLYLDEVLNPSFEVQRKNRITLLEMTKRFVDISYKILQKPIPASIRELIQTYILIYIIYIGQK